MRTKTAASGVAAVVTVAVAATTLALTSPAQADATSPGIACVESNDPTPETTYIGGTAHANNAETYLCPLTVTDMSTATILVNVVVRDFSTTGSVACNLRTCNASLTSCNTSPTASSGAAFTGSKTLIGLAAAGFFGGHAFLICGMPAPMGLGSSQINNYEWRIF